MLVDLSGLTLSVAFPWLEKEEEREGRAGAGLKRPCSPCSPLYLATAVVAKLRRLLTSTFLASLAVGLRERALVLKMGEV